MMEIWMVWLIFALLAGLALGLYLNAEADRRENERLKQLLSLETEARLLAQEWGGVFLEERRRILEKMKQEAEK